MMGDNRLHQTFVQAAQPFANAGDLFFVDPPTFDRQGTRSIHSDHDDFFIGIEWLQIVRNVSLVLIKWLKKASEYVMQGHVVIPWHDNLGLR